MGVQKSTGAARLVTLGIAQGIGTSCIKIYMLSVRSIRCQVALAFINDSVASTHGSVRPNAIFISPSGEWKLGGFEVLSNPKDDNPVLYVSLCWFGHASA